MRQKKTQKQMPDFRTLPPEQRPAVGEKITVASGPFEGRDGIVVSRLSTNRVSVEIPFCGRRTVIRIGRDALLDEDGKRMPKYYPEVEKKEQIEQFKRLESEIGESRLHDYMKYKMGLRSETIEKLKKGEAWIGDFFDEDICEGLGIGIGWILDGDEDCKVHPCGSQMKTYLNEHPERRAQVWKWMQEDGCEVLDYFHGCVEEDWYEEEEYEEYEEEEYEEWESFAGDAED
ncbi:MAG: hypothetical protein LUI87_03400 [Lachnospiraceae bacterium]|nr:hypothetical protein [Lachnospiraceae bacterium]